MNPTRLWFIRHGEVGDGHVGAFVGRLEAPLSDLGKHQAEAVAAYLQEAELDAILSSPRTRARDTASPLSKQSGIDVDVWVPFAEMDFGDWEGLHWPKIEARDPAFAARWAEDPMNIPCPNGEAAGAFAARIQESLESLLEEFRGRSVALFAHAGVNRAILAKILGISYMESFAFCQDYGCVNAAAWEPQSGGAQVALVNMVPGPRSENQGDGPRVDE